MRNLASRFRLRSAASAIGWEIWQPQRHAFTGLIALILICAICEYSRSVSEWAVGFYVPLMGLSLATTFILFKFTESDRRQRFTGFPARLFTLPVKTFWLVTLPMIYGALIVSLIYLGWVGLVFRNKTLPLGWPCFYLATGMVCFQAIVWSLAEFRIARLIALGLFGTMLAFGWIIFSTAGAPLVSSFAEIVHVNIRTLPIGFLGGISSLCYGLALWSVSHQRRGAGIKLGLPRIAFLSRVRIFPASSKPFQSLQAAQFWFEWRRNGTLLPLMTAAVDLLILVGNHSTRSDIFEIVLAWLFALPLVFAFIIGQGFGKTNFWSSETGLPLYLAVRPITASDWLGAKLKVAALSAMTTWLITFAAVLVWIIPSLHFGSSGSVALAALQSLPSFLLSIIFLPLALVLLALILLMLITWRLLVVNLYLGALGNKGLFNAAACLVFLAPFLLAAMFSWADEHFLASPPTWLPWTLAVLFSIKMTFALYLRWQARMRGLISAGATVQYFVIWLVGTQLLLAIVLLMPIGGNLGKTLAMLALFAFPLVRMSFAPLAFELNRHQ